MDVVCLSETKMSTEKIEKIRKKLNFDHGIYSEPLGLSGGLALWWKSNASLQVGKIGRFFIHLDHIIIDGVNWGALTWLYGPNDAVAKARWWRNISRLNPGESENWLVFGDFNDVLYSSDKEGGNPKTLKDLEPFQQFMTSHKLLELDSKGSFFTWLNNREGSHFIRERLDRAISNCSWKNSFPNGHCKVLEAIGSDHCPLLICKDSNDKIAPFLFRFDLKWLSHPDYDNFIKNKWTGSSEDFSVSNFAKCLADLGRDLRIWGQKEFKNNSRVIHKILDQIQSILSGSWSDQRALEVAELRRQLHEIWNQEELYWSQKSRVQWLKCGDQNSRFFHMTTLQRRSRNRITRLRLSDDSWIEDEDQIGSTFAHFYSDLFNSAEPRCFDSVLESVAPLISQDDNSLLMKEVSFDEVKSAVFDLGCNKAPGPDGFTGAFFQKSWPIVGDQVCNIIKRFFPRVFL